MLARRAAIVLVGSVLGLSLGLTGCASPPADPESDGQPTQSSTPSAEPTTDEEEPVDEPTADSGISATEAFDACRRLTTDSFGGATTWASFEGSYVAPDPTLEGHFRVYIETVSHPNSPDEPYEGAASCIIGGTNAEPTSLWYAASERFDPTVDENWVHAGED
jgi:hypothetical protein